VELERKLKHYRLSKSEYERMCEALGREPQGVEWALFSALWSEHCSYKSSKIHLKKLFNKSKRVLQSFGENAGVVDLGEGEKVAFKMESHNHPSFIEPYQGAATGVGGILRDIFTMGARPIALADFLCFGEPKAPRMPALVDGVVRGIGGYGNCVGVPTVTGQTEFHSSYNNNILVNAMAVGLFGPEDPIVVSKAEGVGNLVVYVGAKTGRDGVHGASMASESFEADSASKKPTVQIGDPFFEKLLIESCLDVMKKNLVVAIQDMGAAGLTSSSFEMAAKGGVGFKINLDQVPLRDSSITPEEILLSESQERMLLICEPSKLSEIKKVFETWGLDAVAIGDVTRGPEVEIYWHGENLAKIDPKLLTDNAPQYDRPYNVWKKKPKQEGRFKSSTTEDVKLELRKVLYDVRAGSRSWIYQQYDQRVGAQTARDCAESIAALQLPSERGLGVVLGCRPHVMRWDAHEGGKDAILYPALELAIKGFETLAVTDCLNFGSPEKKEIMSEFVASLEGLSESCERLHAPIISGNVSFYNETMGQNITSTPSTGLVGLREDVYSMPWSTFTSEHDQIFRISLIHARVGDQFGIETKQMAEFIKWLEPWGRDARMHTSRVIGKFGRAYALFRMCTDEFGFMGHDEDLFSENLYEVYFAGSMELFEEMKEALDKTDFAEDVTCKLVGHVRKGMLELNGEKLDLSDLRSVYKNCWRTHFETLA